MGRSLLAVIALASVAALPAIAQAKPRSKPRTPVHPHRADNMPRGFVWPPSATMTAAAAACERHLDALAVAHAAARPAGHIVDAIAPAAADDAHQFTLGGITYTGVFGKGPYAMDCQLAAALTDFGDALGALGVREIQFGSIYRWSKVRVGGKTKDMLSRHALGLAMDVVSIVDASGAEHVVAHDYLHEAKDTGLLHAVEQAVNHSGRFRMVLTPTNDPISHHDHFHIEADVHYDKPAA